MLLYSIVGFVAGILNVHLVRRIKNRLWSVPAGVALFIFLSVIASSILYGEMVKSAKAQLRIREQVGIYTDREEYISRKIAQWNGGIYSSQLVGVVSAFLYFRSMNKKRETEPERT